MGGGNKVPLFLSFGILSFGACIGLGKDLKEKWGALEEGGERSEREGGAPAGGPLEDARALFGEKNRIEKTR